MPRIDLQMDAKQVTAASNELVKQLQAVDQRIASVTSTVATFNNYGNQISAVVKGLTKDGQQFTATMGLLDKEARKNAAFGIPQRLDVARVAFKKTAEAVEETTQKTTALGAAFDRTGRAAQYFVAYRAFSAITQEIESGIKAANEFQIRLSLIRTLSQQNQQTSATFGQQVRNVSDKSGFNVADTGKAFYDAISNQVAKGPQVEKFVSTIADLARVTGSNLVDAGNAVTATINAYGLSAEDATRVSAVLFRTVDEGRVVMSELANTLGRVQVLAANVGVSMEEVSSVLAVTTQKGFKTADSMTLLTNLLIKLEKPTEATKKFFDSLGVSSGEQAIRLFGFYGVMQKIVDLTRSGAVDVSAFFDEIRGRKQFAVFEQSIDQMRNFNAEISNTANNVAHYQRAIAIRGESPADYLNKEFNKIQNIFTVDIGQKILEVTASIFKSVKATGELTAPIADNVVPAFKTAVVVFGAYYVAGKTVTVINALMGVSFKALAVSAIASLNSVAAKGGVVVAGLYAAYEVTRLIATIAKNNLGANDKEVDSQAVERSIARLNDLRRQQAVSEASQLNEGRGNNSLDRTAAQATEAYRQLGGVIAQVNIANNRLLDEAKQKAKETAEAIKVAFSGYTDTIQQNINAIKQRITQANDEIKKSNASISAFKDTLDGIIAATQEKFATDAQRVDLLQNRINSLKARAIELLRSNTPEERQQGRALFDEIARAIQQREELRQTLQAGQAQRSGSGYYLYNTQALRRELDELKAIREEAERGVRTRAENDTFIRQQTLANETARLERLQNAFKAFSELSPFTNTGAIRSEFRTGERFDPSKFAAAQEALIRNIRANAGGNADQRFQLEIEIARHRAALQREATASERRDIIETTQARITAQQEEINRRIQAERDARRTIEEEQRTSRGSLADVGQRFDAFRNATAQSVRPTVLGRTFDIIPEAFRAPLGELDKRIAEYKRLVNQLDANAEVLDGRRVFRDQDIEAVQRAANAVKQQQDALNNLNQGRVPTVGGATPDEAFETVRREVDRLLNDTARFGFSLNRQQGLEIQLLNLVNGPLRQLRQAFPELATAADAAFNSVRTQTNQTITQSIQPLIDKVKELQQELRRLNAGPGPRAGLDIVGEEAYAATGGLVGAFPGQPRGQDRYPIWAAKDEFIVNAQSSRMFRPMLEAINARRTPRYMAQGGVVGGDTTVGDVSITVNGSQSPTETGRQVWSKLQRELRRNNLNRK